VLQLWELEVKQLTGELVQASVAFEDLRIAGEEKDASILQLWQEAETSRADLEKLKKQVESELPPSSLLIGWLISPRLSLESSPFPSRSTGSSWGVGDVGGNAPDGLQLLAVGSGASGEGSPARVSTGAPVKQGAQWPVASGPWAATSPGICEVCSA
jgi:hypothetical protein